MDGKITADNWNAEHVFCGTSAIGHVSHAAKSGMLSDSGRNTDTDMKNGNSGEELATQIKNERRPLSIEEMNPRMDYSRRIDAVDAKVDRLGDWLCKSFVDLIETLHQTLESMPDSGSSDAHDMRDTIAAFRARDRTQFKALVGDTGKTHRDLMSEALDLLFRKYRGEDCVTYWAVNHLESAPGCRVAFTEAWERYCGHCYATSLPQVDKGAFVAIMRKIGFLRGKNCGQKVYIDVRFRDFRQPHKHATD